MPVVALLITMIIFVLSSDVVANGATSQRSSARSGGCTKAAATAVVGRLGLSDVSATSPVYTVLCGAFTGAGSQTMVASILGPENVGMIYWAVFRWSGSDWQLFLKQRRAAILTAAGSDIRETVEIRREGDPRCCPSGGTKARTWHWNSARFTAGLWKQVTSADTVESGHFKTPSSNIVCGYFILVGSRASESNVGCVIRSGLRPAPPRRPCQDGGYAGDRVYLGRTGSVDVPSCAGDPGPYVYVDVAKVLGYGKTWSGGGIACTSTTTGLTCRNKSGHGFFLSREHWRAF